MPMWHALFPDSTILLLAAALYWLFESRLWHGLISRLTIWHTTRPCNPPHWQVGIQQDGGVSTQITDAVNLVRVKSTLPLNTLNQSSAVVCQTPHSPLADVEDTFAMAGFGLDPFGQHQHSHPHHHHQRRRHHQH
jgi:hypothetical protein